MRRNRDRIGEAAVGQSGVTPTPDLDYIAEPLRKLAVPVDRLRLPQRNARGHNERSSATLRMSLEKFGQMKPIVVHGDTVIAGADTLTQTIALGRKHVAAVQAGLLTEEQAAAYGLADNRTAELADWDYEEMARIVAEIEEQDREATGLTTDEIADLAKILDGTLKPPKADGEPFPDQIVHKIRLTVDQRAVVERACVRVRERMKQADLSEGACVQLIAASYMETRKAQKE